jgi:hypothetical protein
LQRRARRLSSHEHIDGLIAFEAQRAINKNGGNLNLERSKDDPESKVVTQVAFEEYLQKDDFLRSFQDPQIHEEIVLLLTDGILADQSLLFLRGRTGLVSRPALTALTGRLVRDAWPALAIFVLTELSKMSSTSTQLKSESPAPLDEIIPWAAREAYSWILAASTGNGLSILDEVVGSEDASKYRELMADLPLPGAIDESDIKAIGYSDEAAIEDSLGYEFYIDGFKRLILHKNTTPPLAIAIIGEWGKGKTSFMRILQRHLEAHRLPRDDQRLTRNNWPLVPRAVTVWFDAWQYDSEERVLAALLQTLAREIEKHFTPYSWLKYRLLFGLRSVLSSWRVAYRTFLYGVLAVLAAISGAALISALGEGFLTKQHLEILSGESVLIPSGLLGGILVVWQLRGLLSKPLGLDVNKLYEEADHAERLGFMSVFKAEFERRIDQIAGMPSKSLRRLVIATSDGREGSRNAILEPVAQSIVDLFLDVGQLVLFPIRALRRSNAEKTNHRHGNRVVIFIDDLDRCRADKIADVLEAIKISLETPNIVFVLGMDDKYVKTGIHLRYKEHIETRNSLYSPALGRSADWWADQYLEKVIQIPFYLPDAGQGELRDLVAELLQIDAGEEGAVDGADGRGPETIAGQPEKARERSYHEVLLAEVDTQAVNNLILAAAGRIGPMHEGNPRRIKAFVNRSRMGLYWLKLAFPDMIQEDYGEAVETFEAWERDLINGKRSDLETEEVHRDQWHKQLNEIRGSLFRQFEPLQNQQQDSSA